MESGKLPTKAQELLQSIRADMRLTKDFFKRVYGWEMDYPGFADQAISALEGAGCSHARDRHFWARGYYVATVGNVNEETILKYIQEQEENDKLEDGRK